MDSFSILFLIFTIFNLILFKQNNFISKKINLFDYPDNKRKLHKEKTAITGGVFIFINLIILFLFLRIDFFEISNLFSLNKREYVSFLLLISSLFLIGLYDDKYDLNPFKKLLLSAFFILISLLIDESLIIKELNFYYFNYSLQLFKLSIPFTLLCILLFLNALNMFDGIDLQVSLYVFLLFFYFIFKFDIKFLILIIPVIIFVIYFNYKKKLFLGDSGTNILATLISFIIIKEYNSNSSTIYCDEIFLIMLIPGIDMLRLFIFRIFKGRNPFSSDNQHLHHLYLNKLSQYYTVLLIQLHIFVPILIFYLYPSAIVIITILSFTLYIINIFYLKFISFRN